MDKIPNELFMNILTYLPKESIIALKVNIYFSFVDLF